MLDLTKMVCLFEWNFWTTTLSDGIKHDLRAVCTIKISCSVFAELSYFWKLKPIPNDEEVTVDS